MQTTARTTGVRPVMYSLLRKTLDAALEDTWEWYFAMKDCMNDEAMLHELLDAMGS